MKNVRCNRKLHTHTHTHTHIHTHTHTCTHIHTHAHTCTHTHTHTHTCTHMHTHAHTCTHMHTCTHAHMHTCNDTIPDQPKMPNYVTASGSNSILDQLTHLRAQGIYQLCHYAQIQLFLFYQCLVLNQGTRIALHVRDVGDLGFV